MKHLTIGLMSLVFLTACGITTPQQKPETQTRETKKLETEVATSETENILEEKKKSLGPPWHSAVSSQKAPIFFGPPLACIRRDFS